MITEIILVTVGFLIFLLIAWRLCSRRYRLPCPTWLGWLVELDNPFSKIYRAETIVKHLDLAPGMVVLDVGCGPGRITIPIARKIGPTGKIVAMDIQEGMLRKVREKAYTAKLSNITLLHARAGDKQIPRNTFDRVVLSSVLGEIPHQEIALQEIFDALKPGGILCVTEIIFDPHYQRYGTVLKRARKVGFDKKNMFSDWFAFTLNLEKPTHR